MAVKVLSIVESASRATLEDKDDTDLWITHARKGAGAGVDVLLRGNAVNYAAKGRDVASLSFGFAQSDREVSELLNKGAKVYVVSEDVSERGLEHLIDGTTPVERGSMAKIISQYDHVWHW